MTRTLTLLLLVPLLLAGAGCQLHSECDANGRRETYLWNDTGDRTLTIVDTNMLPPEDLPYVLVPDTDDDLFEPGGVTDVVFFGNDGGPFPFFLDYQWEGEAVQHVEGSIPDDCPPA